jgi:flagellum-specific ATP synthase
VVLVREEKQVLPAELAERARRAVAPEVSGRLRRVVGARLEVEGVNGAIGDLVRVLSPEAELLAEVVALEDDALVCVPLGWPTGLQRGQRAVMAGSGLTVPAGEGLLGRVLNGLGRPMDGRPLPLGMDEVPVVAPAPQALSRRPVSEALVLGVKAIDTLLTCGRGQRVGLFAGSGVGKSTLLGMLARGTKAECSVIALVGERGREAEEFVRERLGAGAHRSVVVVATSDQPPLVRLRSARVATAIAEGFRDQGRDVLLLMDSLTRFAMAQREVGLAAGEPPATRGYPPSVFSALAGLLERAGTSQRGSITGIYTVLVEGDDMNEPVADASRAILDGHIVLSRQVAEMGRWPAIDVLASVSRLSDSLCGPEELGLASTARRLLATWAEAKDLVEVGAYRPGSSAHVDEAIARKDQLEAFLRQPADQVVPQKESWAALRAALGGARQ